MDGVSGGLICSQKKGRRGAHFLVRALSFLGVVAVAALVSFLYSQGAQYLYTAHYKAWWNGSEAAQFPLGAVLVGSAWQSAVVLLVWAYIRVVGTDPGAVSAVSSRFLQCDRGLQSEKDHQRQLILFHSKNHYCRCFWQAQALSEALLRGASAPKHRRRFPQLTSANVPLLESYGKDGGEDDDNNEEEALVDSDVEYGGPGAHPWPVPPALRLTKCGKCDGVRPPRAHHCMVCGRCILKMDHHW
jgi:hypothetical protein